MLLIYNTLLLLALSIPQPALAPESMPMHNKPSTVHSTVHSNTLQANPRGPEVLGDLEGSDRDRGTIGGNKVSFSEKSNKRGALCVAETVARRKCDRIHDER